MSYEITYRKACVKLADGRTIPVLETGSNNCYENPSREHPRGRRERSRGMLASMIGTKETITPYIKGRIQRYIDDNDKDDYKQWTDHNRKTMNSKYWASWKFPWNINLGQVINYITTPNLDYDIALDELVFHLEANGKDYLLSNIDEALEVLNKNNGRFRVSWVDRALQRQKERRSENRVEKQPKPKGKRIIEITTSYSLKAYLMKLTSRQVAYTHYESWAKRFDNENQAKKRADKHDIIKRFSRIETLSFKKLQDE